MPEWPQLNPGSIFEMLPVTGQPDCRKLPRDLIFIQLATVLSYGAEAYTLKINDERKMTSLEIWL